MDVKYVGLDETRAMHPEGLLIDVERVPVDYTDKFFLDLCKGLPNYDPYKSLYVLLCSACNIRDLLMATIYQEP